MPKAKKAAFFAVNTGRITGIFDNWFVLIVQLVPTVLLNIGMTVNDK